MSKGKEFYRQLDPNETNPHGIICPVHGRVSLSEEEYTRQLSNPDVLWRCHVCGSIADFDDDRYCRIIHNCGISRDCSTCTVD